MKSLCGLVVAAVFAGPVLAQTPKPPATTGADLAACGKAADQPICLLRLAAHSSTHQPYADNINVGYAPEVLKAIGPDPSQIATNPLLLMTSLPERLAVRALIADHAGAAPADALAPIRALPADIAPDPADQPDMDKYAASQRARAYQMLWSAGHGDRALPAAHRPTAALVRAALDAWRAELPKAGSDGEADELAQAYADLGDKPAMDAMPPPLDTTGVEPINRLLKDGHLDQAAEAVTTMIDTGPIAGLPRTIARTLVIQKAVDAGRNDIAIRLAEEQLTDWLSYVAKADPAKPSDPTLSVDIARDVVLIAQLAPRAEASDWVGRLDAVGRDTTSQLSAVSAAAALRGWVHLRSGRGDALLAVWADRGRADMVACSSAAAGQPPADCMNRPGVVITLLMNSAAPDAPWNELSFMAGGDAHDKNVGAEGMAGVEARLAKAETPRERFEILEHCAHAQPEDMPLSVAAACAHRLMAEPEPAQAKILPNGLATYGYERLRAALELAANAARSHDATLHDAVGMMFELAAQIPDSTIGGQGQLEVIAIAELREQGRL